MSDSVRPRGYASPTYEDDDSFDASDQFASPMYPPSRSTSGVDTRHGVRARRSSRQELEAATLRRIKSYAAVNSISQARTVAGNQSVEAYLIDQVHRLQRDIETLRKHMLQLEGETSQWGVRYSRRMAILTNVMLGVWVFISRFILFIRHNYKLTGMLGQAITPGILASRDQVTEKWAHAIYRSYINASLHACLFFVSAWLLARRKSWKRSSGVFMSTGYSLYLAFTSRTMPWTNYINIFTNVLYLFSRYYHILPAQLRPL